MQTTTTTTTTTKSAPTGQEEQKKRAREYAMMDAEGPKAKRCSNCTSADSVDACDDALHEPIVQSSSSVQTRLGQKDGFSFKKVPVYGNAPANRVKQQNKRVIWNESMHKKFLSIIFDIGLEQASPRLILDRWGHNSDDGDGTMELNTNHMKHRLRNYRKNSANSKAAFKEQLEAAVSEAAKRQENLHHAYPFPKELSKYTIKDMDFHEEDHLCPFEPCPHDLFLNPPSPGGQQWLDELLETQK